MASEGADGADYAVHYQVTDHLIGTNDYFAFGLMHNSGIVNENNRFRYNGKEWQTTADIGFLDYGARMYDNEIIRFFTIDWLALRFSHQSPYVYAANNPIRFIDFMGMNPEDPEEEEKKKIGIDPGHGDHHNQNTQVDPGAVNGDNQEKDIVLDISNSVTKKLEDEGYSVIQTRDGDVKDAGERYKWRVDKAGKAEIFVSIHTNSHTSSVPHGFEVFYKKGDTESKSLAESVSKENTLFTNRGVKEGNFTVLLEFSGPAILVETGFISNANDLKIMQEKSADIGNQIAVGIINYWICCSNID